MITNVVEYCQYRRVKRRERLALETKIVPKHRDHSPRDETNSKDIHKEVAHLIYPCSRFVLALERKYGLTIYTSPSFNSRCKAAFMKGDLKSIIQAMNSGIYCIRRQKSLDRVAEKVLIRFILNMPFQGTIFNDFKLDGEKAAFHARNIVQRGNYNRNKRGIRRIHLILLKLEALVYWRRGLDMLCKDFTDYQNKFFEIIRDPVVSVSEVDRLLRSIFDDLINEEAIVDICNDFLLLFPDSVQNYEPRTLKHLTRCSVRKSLQKSGNLQEAVLKLQVPDRIKSYILVYDTIWRHAVSQEVNSHTGRLDESTAMAPQLRRRLNLTE